MDYTSIPRSLFYKEKTDLSIFTRNTSDDSLEYQYFKRLKRQYFIRGELKAPEYVQTVLNNACYICSLIYYEEQPSLYFGKYKQLAVSGYEKDVCKDSLEAAIMALVYNWLNTSRFKEVKNRLGCDKEALEEIIEEIYDYYTNDDEFFGVKSSVKNTFLKLVFEKDRFSSSLDFKDIISRVIDEAVVDSEVKIYDLYYGVDYICEESKIFDDNKYEAFVLTKTLNRLENEVTPIHETYQSYQINYAKNKVRNRLRELDHLPETKEVTEKEADSNTPDTLKKDIDKKDQEIAQLREECEEWKSKYEAAEERCKELQDRLGRDKLSTERQAILDQLYSLVDKGDWADGIAAEKVKTMLKNVLGQGKTPLEDNETEKSELLWQLLESGKGDRVTVTWQNLVGYFADRQLLKKKSAPALNMDFFGNIDGSDNINKGRPTKGNLPGRFKKVIPLLDAYLPKQ